MQTLTSVRRRGWSERIASLPLSFSFFLSFFLSFFAKATGRTVGQIWTTEGSKRVVPRKEVPFLCLKDVLLIFFLGGGAQKTEIFGA